MPPEPLKIEEPLNKYKPSKNQNSVQSVFIFGIFHMYKNYYFEKFWGPRGSEALVHVHHLHHG